MPAKNHSTSRNASFSELVAEAASCTRCPGMCGRSAVLSDRNGSLSAGVMFVGEAPGRKGADRTRVPFSGDQSGRNFERFLASISLRRSEIFITSGVLCNPRSATGANRRPAGSELRNCSDFLQRTIALVDPDVIVTLGTVALEALKRVHYHEFTLKHDAAKILRWNRRLLVPLYHPSPQVLITSRDERAQLRDYKVVARAIRANGREIRTALRSAALRPDVVSTGSGSDWVAVGCQIKVAKNPVATAPGTDHIARESRRYRR